LIGRLGKYKQPTALSYIIVNQTTVYITSIGDGAYS